MISSSSSMTCWCSSSVCCFGYGISS